MGIFDKIFKSTGITYKPQNEQEAWVAIMRSCMAADGEVSEIEIDRLCEFLVFKEMFIKHDIRKYLKKVIQVHPELGSKAIIDSSVGEIREESKGTLLCLVIELMMSDGVFGEKEQEITEYVATALKMNNDFAGKIIEVMMVKNKGNRLVC